MLTHKKYILASSSKSRYKILKNSGFVFYRVKPDCDEEQIKIKYKKENRSPHYIAKKLSFEKAKSVSFKKRYKNLHVIGCDTLIYLDKKIFDKAKNLSEAKDKIKILSGKTHKIVSGITIFKNGKKEWDCSATTSVKLRKINQAQIEEYLKKTGHQILQSVGCYQIEAMGPQIIENIKGDYFNVMGLPLFKLLRYVSDNK